MASFQTRDLHSLDSNEITTVDGEGGGSFYPSRGGNGEWGRTSLEFG